MESLQRKVGSPLIKLFLFVSEAKPLQHPRTLSVPKGKNNFD
jgi:hypothetical protein